MDMQPIIKAVHRINRQHNEPPQYVGVVEAKAIAHYKSTHDLAASIQLAQSMFNWSSKLDQLEAIASEARL